MLFLRKPGKLMAMSLLVSLLLAISLDAGMQGTATSSQGERVVEAGFWTFLKTFVTCSACIISTTPLDWFSNCDQSCGDDWW